MTKKEFREWLKKCKEYETVYLKNGMTAMIKISSTHEFTRPNKISLVLDLDNSFKYNPNPKKAVYKKVNKFCNKNHIFGYYNNGWVENTNASKYIIILHSKKDYNRIYDLFQFLNGEKLAKTARNNNNFII